MRWYGTDAEHVAAAPTGQADGREEMTKDEQAESGCKSGGLDHRRRGRRERGGGRDGSHHERWRWCDAAYGYDH
jgi:hypothetical protein